MDRRRFLTACVVTAIATPKFAAAREFKRHEYFLGPVEDGKVTYLATKPFQPYPHEFRRTLVDYPTRGSARHHRESTRLSIGFTSRSRAERPSASVARSVATGPAGKDMPRWEGRPLGRLGIRPPRCASATRAYPYGWKAAPRTPSARERFIFTEANKTRSIEFTARTSRGRSASAPRAGVFGC